MKVLQLPDRDMGIPRDSIIVDTCVFVSAFLPKEPTHQHAKDFLNKGFPFLVLYVVIAEAWGVMVGRAKQRHNAVRMLRFISEQPNLILIPGWKDLFDCSREFCEDLEIDLVDSYLMNFSSFLGGRLSIPQGLKIATYDTRDFLKCYGSLKFGFLDLREEVVN